jgi:hypothetical protein
MERHLAEHPFTTNLKLQQLGTTVTARNAVETDRSRSIGVDRFILAVTYELRGNQIAAQRITADTSDLQTAWFVRTLQTAPALPLDPLAIHQQYVDATNSGDVAGAVAQFASDRPIWVAAASLTRALGARASNATLLATSRLTCTSPG